MANLSNINNVLRTGSLGVGINRDPASPFEVSSATKPGIKMFNTAASGKTYQAYSDINGSYIIYDEDADSNRLTINSAGNATFAGTVTATGRLTVNTGGEIAAYFNGNGANYTQGAIALQSSDESTPEARGQGVFMYNQGTDTTWYTGTTYNNADRFIIGRATNASLNTESARANNAFVTVLNSGNVGIGTTSPSAKFQVVGTTGLPATSGTAFTGTMRLQVAGGYGTVMDFGAVGPSTGTQWIQVTDASNQALHYPLLLQPNGGNVGIGTTSPNAKLDVKNNDGNASGLHIVADFNQNGGAGAQMILGYYANGSSPVGPLIYAANGMPQLINASGGINFSNDLSFSSNFLYTFRDGVGINNPNSQSAGGNAGYTMYVGRSASGTVLGSISAKGTIRGSAFTSGTDTPAGIGANLGDINAGDLGPGYLNLSRDDTAGAQQIRFEKNGALHSYIETTTSGLNIGNANVYLAKSSNQGQLFFGTSNNQYEIYGGGTFGYMGYNTGGYHRFLANGSEVFSIKSSGELAIKNGANYSTTITYTNAWNAGYQTLIPGAQLSPNSVYIITIRCNSFSTPPYYASTVFHIATCPGTNGGGGGNDNIAPTSTHVNSNVYWQYRLSTIVNGRNGIEAYLVNGPNNPPSYPSMYITATKLMTIN